MGRIVPFIILLSLVGLAIYAGLQTYSFLKGRPLFTNPPSLSQIFSKSETTPTGAPSPTPDPKIKINDFLGSHLLLTPSTCVSEILQQENDKIYIWAICQSSTTGLSTPAVLTVTGDQIIQVKTPGPGANYSADLNQLFPESVRSHAIFTDPALLDNLQKQLSQAS